MLVYDFQSARQLKKLKIRTKKSSNNLPLVRLEQMKNWMCSQDNSKMKLNFDETIEGSIIM